MDRTHLKSIDSDTPEQDDIASAEDLDLHDDEIGEDPAEDVYLESYEEEEIRLRSGWLAPTLALLAIAGWTAFFGWAYRDSLASVTPQEAIALVGSWAPPVALIALGWLIALRTSRRETEKFAEAAQVLRVESEQLEARLHRVNGELSVAREFLTQQSRDLDTLGRLAADRLGEHSGRLDALISENGREVERLSEVSANALENMESLRGNLPVIASSTKDVTNTIAQAGRTAQTQLDEMIAGLKRVNEFGEASETQVESLRARIGQAFEEFAKSTHETGEGLADRYNRLSENVAHARVQFEQEEIEALAAMRQRWSAVGEQIKEAIGELGALDGDVIEPAAQRIADIRAHHTSLAEDSARQAAAFDDDMARRRETAAADQDAAIATLRERLETLDGELAARRAAHEERAEEVAALAVTLTTRLDDLTETASRAAASGGEAASLLDDALATTGERLAQTDAGIRETESLLTSLTDTTVRLLELVRATAEHGAEDLPRALGESEQALQQLEERAGRIGASMGDAGERSKQIASDLDRSQDELGTLLNRLDDGSHTLDAGTQRQYKHLAGIAEELHRLHAKSETLAEHARDELRASIAALRDANSAAIRQIETDGGKSLAKWANTIGEASGAAIDRALETRMEETAGALDEATARAANHTRQATTQLRDQLARIDELTRNLEQRIEQARERAEEQVDNDFSRRAALITESLNSSAIDIAKALSADVTDTAWAAYLKGDRGIFTRRAVRLLDNSDLREIGELYENDDSFREDVSRYIHDFEAMLRQLLSTRDGNSLGVTVLSSDMGKLYVALAQGIERLRS
ncbi:coiled-coil domain-containing protein [Pseudoblastomonas halimionae]|uniref:ATPase n=1 Tax=Alteriqipengyuania halimionae TaxID=1926630 RepID=A0A6I4U3D4_9SPHN|nr:ATPase [Alteriqipengyuania halimionae]MXP09453.1 ATPase [Alteriqipengyuania halimionae]